MAPKLPVKLYVKVVVVPEVVEGQVVHEELVELLYVPAGQFQTHALEPLELNVPVGHAVHADEPGALEYVPAVQYTQAFDDTIDPAGQIETHDERSGDVN